MRNLATSSGAAAQFRQSVSPPFSDQRDAMVLGAGSAERYEIPAGTNYMQFSADGEFWASPGDGAVVAAIPATEVTDGTCPMLNPLSYEVAGTGVTHISFIASAARKIVIECWG